MKRSFICLAVVLISAWCAKSQSNRENSIDIYTDFQQAAPEGVAEALRAEVDAILTPAGVRFRWRTLAEFRSDTVSAAVVVAHFELRCDVAGMVMRKAPGGSLGWTEISDGRVLPFTHVDCGRVRAFLQSTLLGYSPRDREAVYGRALGRVLAHELYHVFASTPQHAASGPAKEEYSVHDLVAANFQFDEKQTRELKAGTSVLALKAAR